VNDRRIIVIGAGGHAKVLIELLREAGFTPVGLIDKAPSHAALFGVPVLGGDDILPALRAEGIAQACVALGANALRQRIGQSLAALGFQLPPAIHPSAYVSPSALVAPGVVVMARAVVNTDTRLAACAIVNSGAVVEHDNDIGEAAHIAPGCALAGNVTVGALALVGVGSAVRPGIAIGARAIVGAGAAVVRDVPEGAVVGGVPAQIIRQP
jgi:UDP-perosamine 4-acetyltransferase